LTTHVERLYSEVVEDASDLLRNLPSEKETLINVLRNIETQCRKVGIFIGDEINELASIKPTKRSENRKSGFLSEELRREIFVPVSVSKELRYLASTSRYQTPPDYHYEHFTQQAISTPKFMDHRDHFQDATSSLHGHHEPIYLRRHKYLVSSFTNYIFAILYCMSISFIHSLVSNPGTVY